MIYHEMVFSSCRISWTECYSDCLLQLAKLNTKREIPDDCINRSANFLAIHKFLADR